MNAGFTKRPWKVDGPHRVNFADGLWEIHWSDEGECVAEIVHGKANAHLIAAAPDMYEALEAAEAWLQDHCLGNAEDPELVFTAIVSALAKARGEA